MNQSKSIRCVVITALFTALIFLVTAYVLHIPTPATGGYIHLGDAFLYLAASMLPALFAVAAGGIGEALSDLLTGGAVFALPTFIIKSAMALCFTSAGKKIVTKRNIAAAILAGVICITGYYLTEAVLYHSFVSPLAVVPANLIQAGSSAAAYLIIGSTFDRLDVRNRFVSITD